MSKSPVRPNKLSAGAAAKPSAGRGSRLVAPLLAASCILAYGFRASLPVYLFYHQLSTPCFLMVIGSLAAIVGWSSLVGGLKPRLAVLLMIGCVAASLIHCEDRQYAGVRLLGWCALLLSLGPLNASRMARTIRSHAYRHAMTLAVVVTLASAAWALLGLPELGRGGFTGVLWHSMKLAPLAAVCGVLALTKGLQTRQPKWAALYLIALVVCMLASSRSALAALGMATIVAIGFQFRRNAWISLPAVGMASLLVLMPGLFVELATEVMPSQVTQGLKTKGWNNSREAHWEARWEEFVASPRTGVGFASGWLDTAGVSEEFSSVEAGSSYLAVLSMTGLVGAFGCLALVGVSATRFFRSASRLNHATIQEVACFGAFWFVHLGAEGYIFAVGSLIGLLFWLWVGRVLDLMDGVAISRRRVPSPARLRTAPLARRVPAPLATT